MKFFLLTISFLSTVSCSKNTSTFDGNTIYVLSDSPPRSINPRHSFDRNSENIHKLAFSALTQIDTQAKTAPQLSSSWKTDNKNKKWEFYFHKSLPFYDDKSNVLTLKNIFLCLENYRKLEPKSILTSALLPEWASTRLHEKSHSISIILNSKNEHLPEIISSFFYFHVTGSREPCTEPANTSTLFGYGEYSEKGGVISTDYPKESVKLLHKKNTRPSINIHFIKDENTRLLSLLKGEGDVVLNGFNLSNTAFLIKNKNIGFIKSSGLSLDYIAFNLKDPILSKLNIRKAIAHAINRSEIIEFKYSNLVELTHGFLPFSLFPRKNINKIDFSKNLAVEYLKKSGLKLDKNGYYLTLNYNTTTQSIGIERALILRDYLRKSGIDLKISVTEPAIFFKLIKEGRFQLYSSRFLKVNNPSFYKKIFYSGAPQNYFSYSNKKLDLIIDKQSNIDQIETILSEDLPIFPLWYWSNVLLYNKNTVDASELKSLHSTGSFQSLTHLKGKTR